VTDEPSHGATKLLLAQSPHRVEAGGATTRAGSQAAQGSPEVRPELAHCPRLPDRWPYDVSPSNERTLEAHDRPRGAMAGRA
jgi:hypothetical protein